MKRNNDIKNYLRGIRNGMPANRLEREALSDPFLYEALEGLTSIPGDPIDGLIRLERQLNERGRGARKKNRSWLYIAASCLVLVMCGTLWFAWEGDKSNVQEQDIVVADARKTPSGDDKSILSMGGAVKMRSMDPPGIADSSQREVPREMQVKQGEKEALQSNDTGRSGMSRLRMREAISTNMVTGVVRDEKGKMLPGVTVTITGTNIGTETDERGAFQLELPEGKTHLTFQFVGMKTQELIVKAGTQVQVKMEESQRELEKVVVAGYQGKETRNVTSAMTTARGVADTTVSVADIDRFNRHMAVALKYPEVDVKEGNEGVILASFELNKRKMPSRIRVKEGFSKESNKELIRLLLESPKWESSLSGKTIYVSVRFTIGKNGAKHMAVLVRENSWE